ncbi:MAG: GH3 auxin-responsive promoter family protein [Anaerovoracaceae bacterium]
MKFEDKLNEYTSEQLWKEYCGFLDLTVDEFMGIQKRLMAEQIHLWGNSGLGKSILKGATPRTLEEFRRMVPLTTYEDYADALLSKDIEQLPAEPILWLQTTWEGGSKPIKVAPYTKSMLDTYQTNMVGCLMLSTAKERGKFDVNPKDTILYGLAPLPYATGIFPLLLNEEISIEFLPPVKEAETLSFSERNKKGFKLGLKKGIDFFFGVGSVTYYVSLSLSSLGKSSKNNKENGDEPIISKLWEFLGSISMLKRLIKGKKRAKKEGRDLQPKDLFKLKGFMCAGTDNKCYKDELEQLWGIRPMEIFAGTEPTCIGTEIWSRDGMYLFPDACFYEFIPWEEMHKKQPTTCLMSEVVQGEKYELVITTLKGGAFARYRVGDVYRCIGKESSKDRIKLPRFEYIDRIPDIIDIAGFTRITKSSIEQVIKLSGLMIKGWVASKEYTSGNKPFFHMYIEMEPESILNRVATVEVLREHFSVYFRYVDSDYKDLKKILGMEPLEITVLRCGTFDRYIKKNQVIRNINPTSREVSELIACQCINEDNGTGEYIYG